MPSKKKVPEEKVPEVKPPPVRELFMDMGVYVPRDELIVSMFALKDTLYIATDRKVYYFKLG